MILKTPSAKSNFCKGHGSGVSGAFCRSRSLQALVLFVAVCCVGTAGAATPTSTPAPAIEIKPGMRILDGEPVHLTIIDVPPQQEITLTAERWVAPVSTPRPAPRLFRSEAVFTADMNGRVDVTTAVPLRGSYSGADSRGLFWSMRVVPDVARPAAGTVDTGEVRFELRVGNAVRAKAALQLIPSRPEVNIEPVAALPGAVHAALPVTGKFAKSGKRPALIIIGGSEGGSLITEAAAPFASHGFAVLALPVFSPPDNRTGARDIPELPAAWVEMPVEETLNRARDWLAKRPDVDAGRIAIHGTSMGAVLAMLGAAHLPWIKSVVANVPSDIVWDGWGPGVETGKRSQFSVAGKPWPFVPLEGYDEEMKGLERKEPVLIRRPHERGRAMHADRVAQARVPVERIRVPLMVIGGYDDQMWPSGAMAENIVASRRAAGLNTEALLYKDVGHLLYETGYAPTTQYNSGLRKTGGTPEANAKAQAEVWQATLAFLRRTLSLEPGK